MQPGDGGPAGGAPGDAAAEKVPRSFVVKHGKVGAAVSKLVQEWRAVMSPNTARDLKERSRNTVRDFAAIATPLGVTHLFVISQTEKSLSLRLARTPAGPTLTFKIPRYSLMAQVKATQKRPPEVSQTLRTAPLVVLNNFGPEKAGDEVPKHVQLMKVTLQNMFPAIDVSSVRLAECRRVVLFHLNRETEEVEMRHYVVKARPTGLSRAVKKVIQAKLPDLHRLGDISDFVDGNAAGAGYGGASDSEMEDEDSKVTLPDRYVGRGNANQQKCALKLQEVGPRVALFLVKVQQGLDEGDTLYHAFVHKSADEAAVLKEAADEKRELKKRRRSEQEENVRRKKAAEEAKRLVREAKRAKLEKKRRGGADSDEGGAS